MNKTFPTIYAALVIVQMFIGAYLDLGPALSVCILPALVICLPLTLSPAGAMAVAFVSGLALDLTVGGIPGQNAAAAVLTVAFRPVFMDITLDSDFARRNGGVVYSRSYLRELSVLLLLACLAYFIVFVPVQCAGSQSFWFCVLMIFLSSVVSAIVGLLAVRALAREVRR